MLVNRGRPHLVKPISQPPTLFHFKGGVCLHSFNSHFIFANIINFVKDFYFFAFLKFLQVALHRMAVHPLNCRVFLLQIFCLSVFADNFLLLNICHKILPSCFKRDSHEALFSAEKVLAGPSKYIIFFV